MSNTIQGTGTTVDKPYCVSCKSFRHPAFWDCPKLQESKQNIKKKKQLFAKRTDVSLLATRTKGVPLVRELVTLKEGKVPANENGSGRNPLLQGEVHLVEVQGVHPRAGDPPPQSKPLIENAYLQCTEGENAFHSVSSFCRNNWKKRERRITIEIPFFATKSRRAVEPDNEDQRKPYGPGEKYSSDGRQQGFMENSRANEKTSPQSTYESSGLQQYESSPPTLKDGSTTSNIGEES
ncbi:hypothetical protein WN48_07995 [Eufriesea mexicana]|nr:hypothetical protein WN48_07995 [Eufriesea mexicana]